MKLSIKQIITISFIGLTTIILILTSLIILLYLNQNQLYENQNRKFESYLLADELRQSSDDLTRLMRTYAVTGDEKYKDYFFAVLDIRNAAEHLDAHTGWFVPTKKKKKRKKSVKTSVRIRK